MKYLILCLATISAHAQNLNGTDFKLWQQGATPWSFSDHYISDDTGIVLTLYARDDRLGNFAPNFRGLPATELPFQPNQFKSWRIEYFCEPDYVITSHGASPARASYLGVLRWRRHLFLDRAKNRMYLTYSYTPQAGLFSEGIKPKMAADNDVYDCNITFVFSWTPADQHIRVEAMIENVTPETRDITLIVQDSAFMWFPYNDQRDVSGFLYRNGAQRENKPVVASGMKPGLAGSYSRTHGVVSAFKPVHVQKSAAVKLQTAMGVAGRYLLVPRSIPVGYQLAPNDQGADLESLLADAHGLDSNLINRYLVFRAGGLPPGERVSFVYELAMAQMGSQPLDRVLATLATQKATP